MKIQIDRLASIGAYVVFFLPYLGTAMPGYLFVFLMIALTVLLRGTRIRAVDLFFVAAFLLFVFFKGLQIGPASEILFRYFFGWFVLYYYFYVTKARINPITLLKVFCCFILVETLLINTVVPTSAMRNFPQDEVANALHQTKFFGFFQRPYSVGTNASISSSILCLILIYIEALRKQGIKLMIRKVEMLAGVCLLLFTSGVGFGFYLLYWGYKLNLFSRWRNVVWLLVGLGAVVGLVFYASTLESNHALSKLSSVYFEFLWDFKANQIAVTGEALDRSSWWIGSDFAGEETVGIRWNDFAVRDMIHSVGFWGWGLLMFFALSHINKVNRTIIIVALIGTLHYGGIFSFPGQFIFAYGLMLSKNTLNYYGQKQ